MRLSAQVVAGLLLAGVGVSVGGGRTPSVDMVSADFGGAVPEGHVGHWDVPVVGRATLISAQVETAGSGTGDVTLMVGEETVGGMEVRCTLTFPCDASHTHFSQAACPEVELPVGARVHLMWSNTCTGTAPVGNAVFGFEWRP